jgi:hypothetical protein
MLSSVSNPIAPVLPKSQAERATTDLGLKTLRSRARSTGSPPTGLDSGMPLDDSDD